jgi:uncharacterized protein (DUF111 family)
MSFTELKAASSSPPRPGGHLHFDATMGCAGDMITAALLDLGLPLVVVRTALLEAGIVDVGPLVRERHQGRIRGLHVSFVDASGLPVDEKGGAPITPHRPLPPVKGRARAPSPRREGRRSKSETVARALDLDANGLPTANEGHTDAAPARGPRRSVLDWLSGRPVTGRELFALIDRGRLAPAVRARTMKALRRLIDARAATLGADPLEATVDGRAAIDLICDLVSVSALIDALAPARITTSAIALSTTPVMNDGAMGPGPSTWVLHALSGMRTVERDVPFECTTPTGAALLWTLAGSSERRPPLAFHRVGSGLGTRELPGIVNVTRALFAERRATVDDGSVMRIEAVIGALVDRRRLVRDLEQKGARAITFARVEDAHGVPLFRIEALVDSSDGGDDARDAAALLDDVGEAVALFPGQVRASATAFVTVPVGTGAKQTTVRVRTKGGQAPVPVDDDVVRVARRLRLDADEVRSQALHAYARLVDERASVLSDDIDDDDDEEPT